MRLSIVAALANHRVIGKDNALPWRIPEDLKRFKALTLGHPVIMGRKTFESLKRPLPGRLNLVLTRRPDGSAEGAVTVHSLDDAIARAEDTGTDEAFVIGGADVYAQALPRVGRMYLTYVDLDVEGDAFFPEWDGFREIRREPIGAAIRSSFAELHRV